MTKWVRVLSLFFSTILLAVDPPKPVYVQALKVDLRAEPKTSSASAGVVTRGDVATIQETSGQWVKIKSGKKTGWISRLFIAGHKPVGNADLMRDVKENIVTSTRRRPSSYSVSATARGLMTSERGREGRELYETDGEALDKMEKYSLPRDAVKKFKSSGRLTID